MAPTPPFSTKQDAYGVVVASSKVDFRKQILETLQCNCWFVEEASGGADAVAKLETGACHVLLLDRWLPDLDVGEVVQTVKRRHPSVDVVVIDSETGHPLPSQEWAQSPPGRQLVQILQDPHESVGSRTETVSDHAPARAEFPERPLVEPFPGMIGASPGMRSVYRLAKLVSRRDTTVVLTGETGTGKELVARAVHMLSPRSGRPFVIVNCAAIPETLLEAELFGHVRGAFTGAVQSRLGRIHAAHGGTLFLDEVGELPLNMQAKLLRFLQEGEVQRLGSADPLRVDVRVIAATNTDPARLVSDGLLRQDLYYRLAVFPIELPPLRKRREDIGVLARHFLALLCQGANVPPKIFSPAAFRLLEQYSWPGNVRELQHMVERAFILSEDELTLSPEYFSLPVGGK